MAITLPAEWGIVDIRDPIPGNSYAWDGGYEPAAAKKRLVTHGTGVDSPTQDGFTMAAYHVNSNGWPGIGVNFVITQDDYPGYVDPQGKRWANPGAQIQYVGDLESIRAGVYGMNPGSVHTEICGLFENKTPSEAQLRLYRKLNDLLLAKNNILPSINYSSQITYHNAIALPGYGTACPGWAYYRFNEWFEYTRGGTEPSWWAAPIPVDAITAPVAPPIAPPVSVLADLPEYETSYHDQPETKVTLQPAFAVDMTGAGVVIPLPVGTSIDIAGYFVDNGRTFARTVYSKAHDKWYGVGIDAFEAPPVPYNLSTATTSSDSATTTATVTFPAPTPTKKPGFWSALLIVFAPLLRLIGLFINKEKK